MIKNIIKWIFAAFFALIAIVSLSMGMKATLIIWLVLAFLVSPLFPTVLNRININIGKKEYAISLAGVLLFAFIVVAVEAPDRTTFERNIAEASDVVSTEEKEETVEVSVEETVSASAEEEVPEAEEDTLELKVHFIDVGQGDCTLIESKGKYMLIDAGPDNVGTKIQKYLMDFGVSKLDYFILTHPDSDHIGSADVIATKFDIDKIYMSSFIKDNTYYHDMLDAFAYKDYKWSIPKEGYAFELGDALVSIIHSKEYTDPNNSSLCVKVTCGETSFLFAGDAESIAEKDMVAQNKDLAATVYHVSHHGSYTSSTQEFLDQVNPEYAVISCAKDNEYGHPHQETLDKLREKNIALFRTDLQGGITAFSDGKEIEWSVIPVKEYAGGDSELEKKAKTEVLTLVENESQESASSETRSIPATDTEETVTSADTTQKENSSSSGGEQKNSGGNGSGSNLKGFENDPVPSEAVYIGNKTNMKLHSAKCSGNLPKEENRQYFNSLEEAEAAGYTRENQCKRCKPFH